eukprot:11789225-Ditylum_brightwellii.AAC.1
MEAQLFQSSYARAFHYSTSFGLHFSWLLLHLVLFELEVAASESSVLNDSALLVVDNTAAGVLVHDLQPIFLGSHNHGLDGCLGHHSLFIPIVEIDAFLFERILAILATGMVVPMFGTIYIIEYTPK